MTNMTGTIARPLFATFLIFFAACFLSAEPFIGYSSADGSFRLFAEKPLKTFSSLKAPLPDQEASLALGLNAAWYNAASYAAGQASAGQASAGQASAGQASAGQASAGQASADQTSGGLTGARLLAPDFAERLGLFAELRQTVAGKRAYFPYRFDVGLWADAGIAWPDAGTSSWGMAALPYADTRFFHEYGVRAFAEVIYRDAPYFGNLQAAFRGTWGADLFCPMDSRFLLFQAWSAGLDVRAPIVPALLGVRVAAEAGGTIDLLGNGLPARALARSGGRAYAAEAGEYAVGVAAELRAGLWKGEIPYLAALEGLAFADASWAGEAYADLDLTAVPPALGVQLELTVLSPYGEHEPAFTVYGGCAWRLPALNGTGVDGAAWKMGTAAVPTPFLGARMETPNIGMPLGLLLGLL